MAAMEAMEAMAEVEAAVGVVGVVVEVIASNELTRIDHPGKYHYQNTSAVQGLLTSPFHYKVILYNVFTIM